MTMGGCGVTVNRTQFFSSPEPHMAVLTCLEYSTGMPLSSMRRIFMPFSHVLWLFIFASIVFMIFLLCMNKKIRTPQKDGSVTAMAYEASVFDVLGTFLGHPLTKMAFRNNTIFGMILWLLTTFVLRNVYLGSLFNILAAQVNEDPVDTIARVIQHNYTVYSTPAAYELFYTSMPNIRNQ